MKSLTTIEFAEEEGEVSPAPPEEGEASPPLKKGGSAWLPQQMTSVQQHGKRELHEYGTRSSFMHL